jgi:adenine-specific DNA-methyltransferase
MDKLEMKTPSLADANFAALAALFPNAVTETIDENGAVVRAIDKDVLTQEINAHVVEGREERYQFTWPDKRNSILLANAPIAAALRPCSEESVDFDTTENLYIEGDNLDVLKLLRETYLNRVKMIYIDPPYNTGSDFIYNDDFSETADTFLSRDGQYDDDGNRLQKNLDGNGRFHTDWLNMIYPRLRIAKDLLSEDGVIFISIDENEVQNLRKVCDEVFGAGNFVSQLGWQKVYSPKNQAQYFSNDYEFVLCYAQRYLHIF